MTATMNRLAPSQVAWVRIDTQTILTIHHNIITRNQRVSLSHHDREIWRLHLERAQESDRGWYMCQVNTDPMRSQRGFLEVVGKCPSSGKVEMKRLTSNLKLLVPPRIVDNETSSDLVVRENSVVNLTCQAEGWPKPELRWRRADGEMIKYQGGTGT